MIRTIHSLGCELEFGDVDRNIIIPQELGSWNFFETDIVNQRDPFWGIAADPQGISPAYGGEINTRPSKTWQEQVETFRRLIELFEVNDCSPTVSCVSNTHIHVNIGKGFHDVIDKLLAYTERNQSFFVDLVYDRRFLADMKGTKSAVEYLNYDSGRLIEPQKFDMLRSFGNSFDVLKAGNIVDGILRNRYAINLQSLIYNQTIEFRCFRATLNTEELANCFKICELFVICALRDGPDLKDIPAIRQMNFPKLNYDHQLYLAWEKTKKPAVNQRKYHNFIEI